MEMFSWRDSVTHLGLKFRSVTFELHGPGASFSLSKPFSHSWSGDSILPLPALKGSEEITREGTPEEDGVFAGGAEAAVSQEIACLRKGLENSMSLSVPCCLLSRVGFCRS